jgi:hypothetical protein
LGFLIPVLTLRHEGTNREIPAEINSFVQFERRISEPN